MRTAGDGILWYAFRWRKVATDEVILCVPWRSHDYTAAIQASDNRQIGRKGANHRGAFQQHHFVEGIGEHFKRNDTERFGEAGRYRYRLWLG